jgi:serine/threonine-protein kinase
VQVAAGQTTSITLDVPTGTLHINALPWAQVAVDGRAIGETPIANLSLPIGSHEVVFRHPELGERRQVVLVKPGPPVRLGVDLRKGQE